MEERRDSHGLEPLQRTANDPGTDPRLFRPHRLPRPHSLDPRRAHPSAAGPPAGRPLRKPGCVGWTPPIPGPRGPVRQDRPPAARRAVRRAEHLLQLAALLPGVFRVQLPRQDLQSPHHPLPPTPGAGGGAAGGVLHRGWGLHPGKCPLPPPVGSRLGPERRSLPVPLPPGPFLRLAPTAAAARRPLDRCVGLYPGAPKWTRTLPPSSSTSPTARTPT